MSGRHAPEPGRLRPALFAVATLIGVVLLVRATSDGPPPAATGPSTRLVAPQSELTLSPSAGPSSGTGSGGTVSGTAAPSGPGSERTPPTGTPPRGATPTGGAPGGSAPAGTASPGGAAGAELPSETVVRRVVIVPRSPCHRFVETERIRTEAGGRVVTITVQDTCR